MHGFQDVIETDRNEAFTSAVLLALIFSIILLSGCAHKPSRTVTIPTPEVEYSQPEFKPNKSIYNPPL